MNSGELEEAIRASIKEQVAQGIRPEDMVITYGDMQWRWSAVRCSWDLVVA